MKTLRRLSIVACVAMAVCAAGALHAQTAAYSVVSTGTANESDLAGYGISGFEFTLNENINVTSLGFTPLSLGGGDTPSVTVWQVNTGTGSLTLLYNTGNILSDVSSQGQGTGNGVPQFVNLSSLTVSGNGATSNISSLGLSSGDTYLVSAPAYWTATYNQSDLATASGPFSSSSYLTQAVGGWNGWANSGYFVPGAPNVSAFGAASMTSTPTEADFQFNIPDVGPVPEPSTYALLLGGLGLLGMVIRRRRAAGVR